LAQKQAFAAVGQSSLNLSSIYVRRACTSTKHSGVDPEYKEPGLLYLTTSAESIEVMHVKPGKAQRVKVPKVQFEISDFGFEMTSSSDFETRDFRISTYRFPISPTPSETEMRE
jgi:hypothetical protein